MPATSNKACTSAFGPIALYTGLWGNYPKPYKPQTGYMPRFAQASLTISPAKQGAQVMARDIQRVHVSKWHILLGILITYAILTHRPRRVHDVDKASCQSTYIGITLRPKHLLHGYMDPWGKGAWGVGFRVRSSGFPNVLSSTSS